MDNETDYNLTDLLKYSYAEKPVDFTQAFNSLIGDKLEAAINNKKLEIAQGIFSAPEEQEYAYEEDSDYEIETDYETEAPEVEENGEIA